MDTQAPQTHGEEGERKADRQSEEASRIHKATKKIGKSPSPRGQEALSMPRARHFEPPLSSDFPMILGIPVQKNGCGPDFWIQGVGALIPPAPHHPGPLLPSPSPRPGEERG